MSNLRQTANGKWDIVGLKHDKPGITIPATFTYNGSVINISITQQPQTVKTEWETPLGTAIDLDEVERVYEEVVVDGKIYIVTDSFTVTPAHKPGDPTISITISPSGLSVDGGNVTYTVTTDPSDTEVNVRCSYNSGVTLSAKTGTFTIPANTATTPVTHTISAWCVDTPNVLITTAITQAAYVPPQPTDPTITLTVSAENIGTGETAITYTATVNPSGTTVKVAYGGQEKTALTGVFTIPANTATTPIDHVITAYCPDYPNVSVTKTIRQAEFVPTLMLVAVNPSVPASGTEITFTVSSNTAVIASFSGQQREIQASTASTTGFNIPENTGSTQISYVVTARCKADAYSSVSKTVTFVQSGKTTRTPEYYDKVFATMALSMGEHRDINLNYSGSPITFNVYSTEDSGSYWKFSGAPEWLYVSPTSGTGDASITISASTLAGTGLSYRQLLADEEPHLRIWKVLPSKSGFNYGHSFNVYQNVSGHTS